MAPGPTQRHKPTVGSIRQELRHATTRAVTLGYGPRFLHSTGQLHKGGPNNGVFIQITVENYEEIPIPGEPYDFMLLKRAQAQGDLEALQAKHRRVVRFHLPEGSVSQGVGRFPGAIKIAATKARLVVAGRLTVNARGLIRGAPVCWCRHRSFDGQARRVGR